VHFLEKPQRGRTGLFLNKIGKQEAPTKGTRAAERRREARAYSGERDRLTTVDELVLNQED